MKARTPFAAAVALAAIALAAACASEDSLFGSSRGDGGTADASTGQFADGGSIGAVSGVVVLHAAAFPAFRLCFENYPDLAPQPDSVTMPAANVVGVEVGSIIRLGALATAPGNVYVIDQREVRTTLRDPEERRCGALLADTDFGLDRKYQLAGRITTPLGVDRVHVLAITGCGGAPWLNELDISQADCSDYDPTKGSLRALTIPLLPSNAATTTTLPVQIVHMSSLLEARRAASDRLDVSFGALDASAAGRLEQEVSLAPPLYDASAQATLTVDQTSEAIYGSHGFRIALRPANDGGTVDDGGSADGGTAAATFFVDQSLAQVQELSFPQTVPTTYYQSASNYVLLLLGDPRIQRRHPDGGANPDYDPRRGVHLLAVPVKDDTDAGTLVGTVMVPEDPTVDAGSPLPDGG